MAKKANAPINFPYLDVFNRGKPRHNDNDDFRIRHPKMDLGKRAKIFSPFDALKGFDEAISSKEELYEPRRELDELQRDELDRRIWILRSLIPNGKAARENRIEAAVTYFVPCEDIDNEAYVNLGKYETLTGKVTKVDPELNKCLYIDDTPIRLRDIIAIESEEIVLVQDRTNAVNIQ